MAERLPKMQVSELSVGDEIREQFTRRIDAEPGYERYTAYCTVVQIDPGPTSTWITYRHPETGTALRIRPRNTKRIVARKDPTA